MNADFLDAHERHWSDAELLKASANLANADHLYGFSAECGLKRLMLAFGMKPKSDGSPEDKTDRVHADKVWIRFESYRANHNDGVRYVLPATSPFHNWTAEQRYAHRSEFDAARVADHRAGAELVRKLIKQAQREGLI